MKKEQLSELLGQVDDDLLLEANRKRKQPRRKLWIPIVALAAWTRRAASTMPRR